MLKDIVTTDWSSAASILCTLFVLAVFFIIIYRIARMPRRDVERMASMPLKDVKENENE